MKIKICGLVRKEDIEAVNAARPDYAGFVFAKSPRQLTYDRARELKSLLDPRIAAVGVFVNAPMADIVRLCLDGVIDAIQLHGDEDDAYVRDLKRRAPQPVIRALRVLDAHGIACAEEYACDYLLLDAYVRGARGGTGRRFDWNMVPKLKKPFFLAGGIDEGNIGEAMRVGVYCLDLSSGAETDGKKDADKILRLVKSVRRESI